MPRLINTQNALHNNAQCPINARGHKTVHKGDGQCSGVNQYPWGGAGQGRTGHTQKGVYAIGTGDMDRR